MLMRFLKVPENSTGCLVSIEYRCVFVAALFFWFYRVALVKSFVAFPVSGLCERAYVFSSQPRLGTVLIE